MTMTDAGLATYLNQVVVADLDEMYLVIGTLVAVDEWHLSFVDADLHDHHEANCTKDVYLLETRKLGIRANRRRVDIPRHRLLALGRLEDVLG